MGLNRKNIRAPQAISTICPHCGERVVFTTRAHIHDEKRESIACTGACPACSEYVHFWSMNPKNSESTAVEDPETIYMSPDGSVAKEPMDFSIELPEALERAYLSAVEAHSSANYSATALCCKQAMEKIFFSCCRKKNHRLDSATRSAKYTTIMISRVPLKTCLRRPVPAANLNVILRWRPSSTPRHQRRWSSCLNISSRISTSFQGKYKISKKRLTRRRSAQL